MRSAVLTASLVLHSPTPAPCSLLDEDMPDIQSRIHLLSLQLLLWDHDHGQLATASSDVAIGATFEEMLDIDPKEIEILSIF